MRKLACTIVLILVLSASNGCEVQTTEPTSPESTSPTPTPSSLPSPGRIPKELQTTELTSPESTGGLTPTLTSPPSPRETAKLVQFDSYTEQFLVDHVGLDYFREHFTLLQEEVVESGVVKATYDYTYVPYVQQYQMTMLLDTGRGQLYDREISRILLEPQHFEIEPEQAIKIALENGLSPGESYEVNVVLDLTTNNRFAWEVISHGAGPTSEVPEPAIRVVLDAEGGEVYAIEKMGPMKGHGSS